MSLAPSGSKYLSIFLNDHLAGSTGMVELSRRIAGGHAGTDLGRFAEGLAAELAEDRATLIELMGRVGATKDRAKVAAGWAAEKVGRLKLNGELRRPSPLSPVVELEALSIGLETARLLWSALAEVEAIASQLGRERLSELEARAADQRERVEVHRRAAVRTAFTAA